MNILYCDECGTRIDDSESVLIKGKDYCAKCASNKQTADPSRGSKTFPKLQRPPSSDQIPRHATPSAGVGHQRTEGSSTKRHVGPPTIKVSAGAQKRPGPPESDWSTWMRHNTALISVLGVGVVGLIAWAALSASPSKGQSNKLPPTVGMATTKSAPITTAPATTAAATTQIKIAGPGFLTQGNELDIGLESAKEAYENEIKPLAKRGNSINNLLPLEKFLKDKVRFKAQAFFKEAEQMLRDIKDVRRKTLRPEFDAWFGSAKAGDWEARIDKSGPPKVLLPFNEKAATDKVSGHSGDKTVEALASEPIKWEDGGIFGQKAPALGGTATFEAPGELGDLEKDQAYSYGCWVKLPSLTPNGIALIGHMDDMAGHSGWDLFIQGAEVAAHLIHTWPMDAIKIETSGSNILKTNVWQHVFVTFDGSGKAEGFKIFVDGKDQPLSVSSNNLMGSARVNTPLTVGRRKSTSFVLPGTQIQDVRLYNRKLTPDEVLQLAFLPQMEAVLAKAPNERAAKETSELFDAYIDALLEKESLAGANQFLRIDTATQGTWTGVYGSQGGGFNNAPGGPTFPSYVTVAIAGSIDFTWADSTTDVRALQVSSGSSSRSATCWFSSTSFTIDVNLTDGQSHQIALYAVDWDNCKGGRSERIDLVDASTGTTLNSQTVSSFVNGKWLVWNVSGHVKFVVTNVAGDGNNAVISGIMYK